MMKMKLATIAVLVVVSTVALSQEQAPFYGLYHQNAVTDPYVYSQILRTGWSNLFDFIATDRPEPDSTPMLTRKDNFYKFWAYGMLKRGWCWGDDVAANREWMPFMPVLGTDTYNLRQFNPLYEQRFKEWLVHLRTFSNRPRNPKMFLVITLFDLHDYSWDPWYPPESPADSGSFTATYGTWCDTGEAPYWPTNGCKAGFEGNPWYPKNNVNYDETGFEPLYLNPQCSFFDPYLPNRFETQKRYVENVLALIDSVLDSAEKSRVILELIHEPPEGLAASCQGSGVETVIEWMKQMASHIRSIDNDVKIAVQISSTASAYFQSSSITDITPDYVTAEMGFPESGAYSWCYPDYEGQECSTVHLPQFVVHIRRKFGIPSDHIIVDTDGDDCRNHRLPALADAAYDHDVSFAHLFDLVDEESPEWGPISREDHREAVIAIWSAYNHLQPN